MRTAQPIIWTFLLLAALAPAAWSAYSQSFLDDATDASVKAALEQNQALRSIKFVKTPLVTDAALAAVQNQPNMEIITFVSAKITGTGLKALSGLNKLKKLELEACTLTEEGLKNLPALPVSAVNFVESTVDDRGAWYISYTPTLEYVNLGQTQVTDAGVSYLTRLPKLKYLYLYNNAGVTDKSAEDFGKMAQIELLDIRFTGAGAATVRKVVKLPRLKHLLLGGDAITDDVVALLHGQPTLERLSLSASAITDGALPIIAGLPMLKSVELYRTNLSADAVANLKKARPELAVIGTGEVSQ